MATEVGGPSETEQTPVDWWTLLKKRDRKRRKRGRKITVSKNEWKTRGYGNTSDTMIGKLDSSIDEEDGRKRNSFFHEE